jgi:perosamine synthetase
MPGIPIAKPTLGSEEIEAAARCISSGWLTQGPEVAAFEREFADAVGAPHACAVSNCTTALHLALQVAGVGEGDEVITASHSFIATANAIRYLAAVPVFVDVEPHGYNTDPSSIEAAITPRTKAILCVHQIGMPCDIEAIVEVARRHGVRVIEDAACAIGSEIFTEGEWQRVGKPHGDVACFSFHPRKVITTGDGGMLTTKHAEWDQQFRLLRQHGMSIPDTVRHNSREVLRERYDIVGYNYRMTDLQAAVGRAQLRRLAGIVERRRALARRYCSLLAAVPGIELPVESAKARSNWQSFAVRLGDAAWQRPVMQALLDAEIATRRGVMCAHREAAYAPGTWRGGSLQNSERAEDATILLPLYTEMSEDEQDRVVAALSAALQSATRAMSAA